MLSRRQFLQAAGIAVAAAHAPRFTPLQQAAPVFEPLYGRALHAVPVYGAAQTSAPVVQTLWSDAVVPILDIRDHWYRLPDGFAQRHRLQPMTFPAQHGAALAQPPFWAEVAGAAAAVRAWCAATAPVVTRIGHGGVLYVRDRLTLDGIGWYAAAERESGDLLGWTQAAAWQPAAIDESAPSLTLVVDTRAQQLTVRDGSQSLLTAPVSTGQNLAPGRYAVAERRPILAQADGYYGASWVLTFGAGLHLAGVYWHNQFGEPYPGAAVQVTPALARWLYGRAAEVIVA